MAEAKTYYFVDDIDFEITEHFGVLRRQHNRLEIVCPDDKGGVFVHGDCFENKDLAEAHLRQLIKQASRDLRERMWMAEEEQDYCDRRLTYLYEQEALLDGYDPVQNGVLGAWSEVSVGHSWMIPPNGARAGASECGRWSVMRDGYTVLASGTVPGDTAADRLANAKLAAERWLEGYKK